MYLATLQLYWFPLPGPSLDPGSAVRFEASVPPFSLAQEPVTVSSTPYEQLLKPPNFMSKDANTRCAVKCVKPLQIHGASLRICSHIRIQRPLECYGIATSHESWKR